MVPLGARTGVRLGTGISGSQNLQNRLSTKFCDSELDTLLADYAWSSISLCGVNVTSLVAYNVYNLKTNYVRLGLSRDGVDTVGVCESDTFESKRSPRCSVSSPQSLLSAWNN
jgi:hypothetical protein